MFDLSGRTALVTGATGGIGGAIARALHSQGATVAVSGTRPEALQGLASELGERVRIIPNHTCVVTNLHDEVVFARDGEVVGSWPIPARGMTR